MNDTTFQGSGKVAYVPVVVNAKQSRPQTNGDRIRAMTDEELARFIANQRGRYCDFKDPEDEEYENVLPWLKSQVEVGE